MAKWHVLRVCIIATLNAIEKVGLSRSQVSIFDFLELHEHFLQVLFKAEKKIGILFNQAIVFNLQLFSDVFQCKFWNATSMFKQPTLFSTDYKVDRKELTLI